jgi:hypothetical protein
MVELLRKMVVSITDMELKQDSPLDGYLEPKFPIVKSSLVQGKEP